MSALFEAPRAVGPAGTMLQSATGDDRAASSDGLRGQDGAARTSHRISQMGASSAPPDDGIGGDGAPDYRFLRDDKDDFVYSDEVQPGPWCWCDTRPTGDFREPRDNKTTFHGGIDIAPVRGDGQPPPLVFSKTHGVVERIGASGFGPNAVIVRTPQGNWATYGHLDFNQVNVGDRVFPGMAIGLMGSQGNSTGKHLHFQITTGEMFGDRSRFLGVRY